MSLRYTRSYRIWRERILTAIVFSLLALITVWASLALGRVLVY